MPVDRDYAQDCVGCRHLSLEGGWCNYGENTGELWSRTGAKRGPHGGCVLKDGEMKRRSRGRTSLDPEDNDIRLRLYRQGMTDEEIARKVGAAKGTIAQWRSRRGLPNNEASSRDRQEILAERRELYDRGLNDREIADRTGWSVSTISKWRKDLGLAANAKRRTT